MSLADQLDSVQSRINSARRKRRFANAVGRHNEAQHWNLELDNLGYEASEFEERIAELNEEQ
jgi:hypothetical protein